MSTVEQHRPTRISPSKADVDAARALARAVGLEYVDLDRYPLNAAAKGVLSEQLARRHHVLAVGWKYGTPVIAVATPGNMLVMDDVRTAAGRDIHAVVACMSQLDAYIDRMYSKPIPRGAVNGTKPAEPSESVPDLEPAPQAPDSSESPAESAQLPAENDASATEADQPVTARAEPAAEAELGAESVLEPMAGEAEAGDAEAGEAEAGEAEAGDAETGDAETVADDAGAGEAGAAEPEGETDGAGSPVESETPESVTDVGSTGTPAEHDGTFIDLESDEVLLEEVAEAAAHAAEPVVASAETPDLAAVPLLQAADIDLISPVAKDDVLAWAAESAAAMDEPAPFVKPSLTEVLVASGQVTHEEMQAALRESAATGRSLGVILNELGLVTEEDLIRWMAEEAGLEFVDLNDFAIDSRAIALLPETMARRHQLLAIGFRNDHPVVAMANPSNVFALDDLRTVLGRGVETVVSSPRQITDYISRMYRHDKEAADAARNAVANQTAAEVSATATELTDLLSTVDDAPIIKYVNLILRQALQERASDVHVEPAVDDLRVRFRIDGVLHDITRSPKSIQGGVTTRLKVMANLDIAEHRIPQDGRISLTAGNREIDLRVATLPTVHGEKVVLRILDKTNAMMDLSDLGFLPEVDRRYQTAYRKPYGTILITGPTGSGKSTTLYATLNALNSPERNLITVEDPVEYQLPGVNQVQVNPKAGLTFASALRSILRSDPDIILVGEMRDRETAIMGVEAALTGHLVLSSLHTNDAAGTPMRLVEMGVEPFLVGSALDCIVAQRLARQLCDNCNEPHNPSIEELAVFGWKDDDAPAQGSPRFRRAVGCQACGRTGYRGRIALHELLIVSEEVTRAVISSASAEEIQHIGVQQGSIPLRHDGLRKAALGLTSLEEVIRVVV